MTEKVDYSVICRGEELEYTFIIKKLSRCGDLYNCTNCKKLNDYLSFCTNFKKKNLSNKFLILR